MKNEKYITDGGYGVTSSDAQRGYSAQDTHKKETDDEWMSDYEASKQHSNIGFGRDTGNAR